MAGPETRPAVLWADGGLTAIETFVRGPWEEEVLLL